MTTLDHPYDDLGAAPTEPPAGGPASRTSSSPTTRSAGGGPDGRVKRATHRWTRWLHVYTSMIALLIVLFFGVSGITLNHPSWTFGDNVDVTTESGTLPIDPTFDDGTTDYLSISEFVRDEYGVSGQVDSYSTSGGQATIAYRNAGYAADLFVDVDDATYELTIEQQGWVGVMNDLHKGRDTTALWRWVIDIAAGFLVVISLTGLAMQFFLRKRRRSALTSAGIGAALIVVLIFLTLA